MTVFRFPSEETLVSNMDTDNHLVKGVTRYPRPVFMSALEQLRQMRLQTETPRIQTITSVIPLLQSKEVVMHIVKVIEHITQAFDLRMLAYLKFIGSHGFSRLTSLTFIQDR